MVWRGNVAVLMAAPLFIGVLAWIALSQQPRDAAGKQPAGKQPAGKRGAA